jgi:predicted membrane metal-binding protein
VGLEPAIVRAAIMCTLMLMANWTGREYLAGRSLLVTGGLMLLLNPGLINSIGFWLSITSTAGLIWLSPVVEGMVKKVEKVIKVWEVGKVGEVGKAELKVFSTFPTSPTFLTFPTFSNKYLLLVGGLFKESFVSSLSAQIVTWPILLLFFHQISWLALVVNVLVLWTIPLIMCLGLIKLFFGLFSFYLGSYGSLLVWLPLELFYKVNVLFGSASGVVIDLNNVMSIIPAEAVYIVGIAYYLMLIDMVCVVNRKKLSKN